MGKELSLSVYMLIHLQPGLCGVQDILPDCSVSTMWCRSLVSRAGGGTSRKRCGRDSVLMIARRRGLPSSSRQCMSGEPPTPGTVRVSRDHPDRPSRRKCPFDMDCRHTRKLLGTE